MTTYETTAGTEPDIDEQHEARTMRRVEDNQITHMLTEIEDGNFVAWDMCARCTTHVKHCGCPTGPQAPSHALEWAAARFSNSFATRGVEPPLPVDLRSRNRVFNAVVRKLRADGWTIIPAPGKSAEVEQVLSAAQEAADAAYGDSNDAELGLLRDALEAALHALGLAMPEGVDPDAGEDTPEEDLEEPQDAGTIPTQTESNEEDTHDPDAS